MEAPECGNCVCGVSAVGYRCGASILRNSKWVPGTACPFTTINTLGSDLAAKDAEMAKLIREIGTAWILLAELEQGADSDTHARMVQWYSDNMNALSRDIAALKGVE